MSGKLIIQPFAGEGDLSLPPQTDPSGFVNWAKGYTTDYEIDLTSGNPQAKAVERAVQNALFNIFSANQQQWQRLGFSEWFGEMPGGYPINAQVMRLKATVWTPYRNNVEGNVADPLVAGSGWDYVPFAGEALQSIPMPSGGPGGSAALLVTVATDFNSFGKGTWNFRTDAIAASSAHAPAAPGGATVAGMLESMAWTDGASNYVVQRYVDRLGNSFFRGAKDGTWGTWGSTVAPPIFSSDTSVTVNLVSATFPIPSSSIPDNSQFWVKIKNTNTAALTFTPNPAIMAALAVVGQAGTAMQGGEVVANGRALFIYKADTNNFALVYCSGGALQAPNATGTKQTPNLGQVNSLIQDSASSALLYYMAQIS